MQPDVRLYSSLLSVSMDLKDFNTSRAIISHLETKKIQPDLILQTILIKTFSKLGEKTKALHLWTKIKVLRKLDDLL